MKDSVYMNFVLTVIAVLLALNFWVLPVGPVVRAQNATTRYKVAAVTSPEIHADRLAGVQKELDAPVQGGEIVAMAGVDEGKNIVVVLKRV